MIKYTNYSLQETTLTPELIRVYTKTFWTEIFVPINNIKPSHLLLMCKVKYDGEYKTIADLRKVNINDRDLFTQYLVDRIGVLSDSYTVKSITEITFSYLQKDGLANDDRLLLHPEVYQVSSHKYNNLKLPLSMNPEEYGVIIAREVIGVFTRYVVDTDLKVFTIDVYGNYNKVKIQGHSDVTYIDTKLDDNTFKRVIGKNTIYIKYGEVVVKSKELNAKPITSIKPDTAIKSDSIYMAIDIESVRKDNKMIPYLICGYNKDNFIYEYADSLSAESRNIMFHNFIKQLVEVKGVKYVYAHNFAGYLITKTLTKL